MHITDKDFWWWLERGSIVATVATPLAFAAAYVLAVVTKHNQSTALLVAAVAFTIGAAISSVATRIYLSMRPRHDFKVIGVRREYEFDEADPAIQTQGTHQQLRALSNQAQFLEHKYHWEGGGVDHGLEVDRPDYSIFGPVQRELWKVYFIFLGSPSPRGTVREIEWRHRIEDPEFTRPPLLTSAAQSNPGTLDLKVTFSSKKLPADGRVVFRETSGSGPSRSFTEKSLDLNQNSAEYRVEHTKVGRAYGLYWQWDQAAAATPVVGFTSPSV